MSKRITAVFTAFFLLCLPIGCGTADQVYLESAEYVTGLQTEDTETDVGSASAGNADDGDAETGTAADSAGAASEDTSDEDNASAASGRGLAADSAENTPAASGSEPVECYVYVCGAVVNPGVYVLKENSRIYEAVALAGGLTEDASAESVNQAQTVSDGQMIRILTKEEAAAGVTNSGTAAESGNTAVTQSASGDGDTAGDGSSEAADGKVNLNTASATELMTLPGIGQSKADSIIAYRESCGGFSGIEEIMNVDGIKEGVYNRIKDYIKVK